MENDLFFETETSDMLTGSGAGDDVQIAAVPSSGAHYADALTLPLDAAQVEIPQGENVVRVPVTPGEVVQLPFAADSQFLAREDNGNLAIKVGDITVILQGYVQAAGTTPPVIEASNGQPIDIATILASTDPNIDIQTAAGPAAGPQGQGADNTGGILQQFGEGAGLGGFEGAGAQDGTDGLGNGPVDQTGTLFVLFGATALTAALTADDQNRVTDEDTKILDGQVTATDPEGDPLTYSLVTGPATGKLVFNANGSWTYDPDGKFEALNTDSPPAHVTFTYKVTDGVNESTATVTIDINGVNDDPIFKGGSVGNFPPRSEDDPAPIHDDLKWAVIDVDDTKFTVTVDPATLPPGVTYDAALGRLNFDTLGKYDYLKEGEIASFIIKFTITDAHGGSVQQDYTFTMQGKNDAPVLVADTITNDDTSPFYYLPQWVLTVNDQDKDGDPLLVNDLGGFKGTGKEDLQVNTGFVNTPYTVTDGHVTSAPGNVHYQHDTDGIAATVTGTDGNDILTGNVGAKNQMFGGKGDDIIVGYGGAEIFGGQGDDTLVFNSKYTAATQVHGEDDTVATKDGLEGGAAMHGDILAVADLKLDFSDHTKAAGIDGIETISTQSKFGGFAEQVAGVVGQAVTIGAHSVQDISDHTITPGGLFPEKDAVRIDGDSIDQLYLSISKDGGNWADTGVVVNGYHVFAHETTAGVETSTDAYVMVQQSNVANVHLNQDAP